MVNFAVKAAMLATFLDANRVKFDNTPAHKAMQPSEVAERGQAISAFVMCRGLRHSDGNSSNAGKTDKQTP